MKNICVFCGSSSGANDEYKRAAEELGQYLAANDITLVYGGGRVGLMGIIADAVMTNGGKVIGVIPEFLQKKEVGHPGLTEMHVVGSMHERKQMMAELSDGFIAMPGGLGTLEELAEITTWVQIEIIKKPVGILNINAFFDHLLFQLDHMTGEGFISQKSRMNIIAQNSVNTLMKELKAFKFDDYSIWGNIDRT